MNCIKRGWLYTTRKKGKSFLLFCILFLIAVFVLSALAIDKASSLAQDNLRKSLGGEFTIGYDYSEANPYLNVEAVDGGTIMYSTQQITPDLIEEISKIKGVQYCSATTETLTAFSTIDFFKGNIPIEEEFRNTTKILGVWKSEENKHFTSKQINLVEGRHITPQDKGKVILSKDLAVKNQIQVGDILKTDKGIDLEIVGLFQQNETESINEQVTSYDKIQNLMIADLATLIALENSPAIQGFNEMTVSISDPQSMQKIISTIKDIKTVDWKGFSIIENNENYDKATSSLQQISNLVSTFLVIIFIASVIILSIWQLPLCLFLAKKIGMFGTIFINTLLGIFLPPLAGNTDIWFLFPHCWSAKLSESLMGIEINGTLMPHINISLNIVFIVLVLTSILFIVLSASSATWFSKQEG